MLCSLVFFAYPGVGYNNQYILFENLYSIVTHALLLTTSITLVVLRFTEFKYRNIWKVAVSFLLTYVYGLVQVFLLKTHEDPMYFMPDGDIQADILNITYGLYLVLYTALIVVFVNAFYLIDDRKALKAFFTRKKRELSH